VHNFKCVKIHVPNLNDSSDCVEVPHDQHKPGRHLLKHVQHPVVKVPDGGAQLFLFRFREGGKGAPAELLGPLLVHELGEEVGGELLLEGTVT
jgi:hypothetical protein